MGEFGDFRDRLSVQIVSAIVALIATLWMGKIVWEEIVKQWVS